MKTTVYNILILTLMITPIGIGTGKLISKFPEHKELIEIVAGTSLWLVAFLSLALTYIYGEIRDIKKELENKK